MAVTARGSDGAAAAGGRCQYRPAAGHRRGWGQHKGGRDPRDRASSHSRSPAAQCQETLERGRVPGRAQMALSDEFKAFSFPSVFMNGEWPLVVGTDDQAMGWLFHRPEPWKMR